MILVYHCICVHQLHDNNRHISKAEADLHRPHLDHVPFDGSILSAFVRLRVTVAV